MNEILDIPIGTYFLFLLFIFIPQIAREDNSFFFAIFKFYFVTIPIAFACGGVFLQLTYPIFEIFGIFLEFPPFIYLYFYCLFLFFLRYICKRMGWNYQKW